MIGEPLTAHEKRVLAMVADGLSIAEIAARLWLLPATVRLTVRGLRTKLQARDRAHAVAIAYRRGVIEIPDPPLARGGVS